MANPNLNMYTSNLVNLPDPMKSWEFQVVFEAASNSPLYELLGNDDLTIRVSNVEIPEVGFGELGEDYMGLHRTHPGKKTGVNGTTTIKFNEYQDMRIHYIMNMWQSYIFNHASGDGVGANIGNRGASSSNYLRNYAATMKVYIYDSALSKKLPYYWKFEEVYPKSVSGYSLGYASEERVEISVTMNYNMFNIVKVEDPEDV